MTESKRVAIITGNRVTAILLDDVEADISNEIAEIKSKVEAAGLDPDLVDLAMMESRELTAAELRAALIPTTPDLGRSIYMDTEPRAVDHRHRNRPDNGHPRSYRKGRK